MKRTFTTVLTTMVTTALLLPSLSAAAPPTASPRPTAAGVEIVGNVVTSKPLEGTTSGKAHTGMYGINTATGEFRQITSTVVPGGYGAFVIDDIYYTSASYRDNGRPVYGILGYDMSTWKQVSKLTLDQKKMATTAVADVAGVVYGTFPNPSGGYMLATLDITNGTLTQICTVDAPWAAAGIASDGLIYAVDNTGFLWKVTDSRSGAMTKVGNTGIVSKYLCGGCIDPATDRLYYSANPEDGSGKLYEINIKTAEALLLHEYKYSDQVTGIYLPFIPDAKAPADPVVTLNFPEGTLSGSVDIQVPDSTSDGEPASGNVTYIIYRDGVEAARGSASCGSVASVAMTLAEDRDYVFKVQLSNAAGVSRTVKSSMFIGMATPLAPAGVKNEYKDGRFHLSWNKVTGSKGGGYMPRVTYDIVRMPGSVTVAKGIDTISFTEPMPLPTRYTTYYYTVTAVNGSKTSTATVSPMIGLGENQAPWFCSFDTIEQFYDFTVVDVAKNKKTWTYIDHADFGGIAQCDQSGFAAKDDWLIAPPIRLEAGKKYKISFESRAGLHKDTEKVEAKIGTAATAEAMTVEVVSPTDIPGRDSRRLEGSFTPPATGLYYLGIHGISPKGCTNLYADNITISDGVMPGAPEAPVATVTPDYDGELKVTVAGTAPLKSLDGKDLSEITAIEIYCDRQLVNRTAGCAPGDEFSIEASVPAIGQHTFNILACNSQGAGESMETTAYVGINKPTEVTNIQIVETETHGKVRVTWTPPTVDVAGKPLNLSKVTYSVADSENGDSILAENLTEPIFTYTAVEPGVRQKFVQVSVRAHTMSGHSYQTLSGMVPAGEPDAFPYRESFAGGAIRHIIGSRSINADLMNSFKWRMNTDASLNGLTSFDNDNGYAAGFGNYSEYSGELFTGKIDLRKAINPELSFATFSIDGEEADANELRIAVKVAGVDTTYHPVFTKSVSEICGGARNVWRVARVNLASYKGKEVEIAIRAISKNYQYTFLDALAVEESMPDNLAAEQVTAPEYVVPCEPFKVSVLLQNKGANKASGYTLELYRGNDEKPAAVVSENPEIAPGAYTAVEITDKVDHTQSDETVYTVKVIYDSDGDLADNSATSAPVRIQRTVKPAPTALSLNSSDSRNVLCWTAPDLSTVGGTVTEDFEGYASFANFNVGDWMFVDMDGAPIGGFKDKDIPAIARNSRQSFFVFDKGDTGYWDDSYDARSGKKFLASMFRSDDGQVDDWVISPRLSGKAQTVTFWAKSYSGSYPEKIETRYSLSDRHTDSFILKGTVDAVPDTWTEYSIEVPEGARYFAVRSMAKGAFMLMLDDFTYEAEKPSLLGYNVYCDGVKLNSQPVAETAYTHLQSDSSPKRYYVTALYDGEESRPSNVVEYLSIGEVYADSGISVEGNVIKVVNGGNVIITDVNGIVLHSSAGREDVKVEVAPGVYIVRTGNAAVKVLVK